MAYSRFSRIAQEFAFPIVTAKMGERSMEFHQPECWKIESSEHEAQGFVTCTAAGAIVWRGPLAELSAYGLTDVEMIYCHDDDVGMVERKLSEESKGGRKKRPSGAVRF
jgi:hypothetical protein